MTKTKYLKVLENWKKKKKGEERIRMREGLMIRPMRLFVPCSIFRFFFPKWVKSLTAISSPPPQGTSFFCNFNTSSSDSRASEVMDSLTKQQQDVLTAISEGKSVFLTGSGGTGKTFLLEQAINILKEIHNPKEVFVTASTGIAACALNGQTLHSFSGIGLGVGDKQDLLNKVAKDKQATKRWKIAKALVIDEISMVSGELFDSLEFIARKNRSKKSGTWGNVAFEQQTWGGIQLIVSGDFFQLPPIINKCASSEIKEFAFEADCWDPSFDLQVEITQVFRQTDSHFIELLQGIRRGVKDSHHLELLSRCCLDDESTLASEMFDSSNTPPRLFPRNDDVRRFNDEKLRNLGGEIVNYKAVDTGYAPWTNQLRQGIAPDELGICVGARVMLIKNKDIGRGLVNGATGTITGFVEQKNGVIWKICPNGGLLPKVRFDSGLEMVIDPENWDVVEGEKVLATRKQIPLILAWAISIHKCQGMTIDRLHTDLSKAFGCGMVYVALSRVRSLDGLYLSGFDSSKIKANRKVLEFYEDRVNSS